MHLLPVPGHLPVERRPLGVAARLAVAAVTIDFGNTLVGVDRAGLRGVVEQTAARLVERRIIMDAAAFLAAWVEERDRQFREDVPAFREPDMNLRAARVLARLRGMAAPPADVRWDDASAAALVEPGEIDELVKAYGSTFVERMAPVADATATLERLAGDGFAVAILSNWPLAATIDRFAAAQGWLPFLRAIVVSQRVGTIKPHPAIFRAAEAQLGLGESKVGSGAIWRDRRAPILHVGDDWAADVVGAARAGWHSAYLRDRQADTPLPTSEPGDGIAIDERVEADLLIDQLAELPDLLELDRAAAAALARASETASAPAPASAP